MNQQPLEDVRMTAQVRPSHSAGFVQVSEGTLHSFATHAL